MTLTDFPKGKAIAAFGGRKRRRHDAFIGCYRRRHQSGLKVIRGQLTLAAYRRQGDATAQKRERERRTYQFVRSSMTRASRGTTV